MTTFDDDNSIIFPCKAGCNNCELCSKIDGIIHSELKNKIDDRIQEFRNIDKANKDALFGEMCFCILTANFNAVRGIQIQKQLGTQISSLNQEELATKLKELGYRFPNTRANYIFEANKWYTKLESILFSYALSDQKILRNWLAKNVKGLGLKEASHFLRNIGFDNCAIIDFHIIDILVNHSLISKPKTLTQRKYEEIERVLENIAQLKELTLAELDLVLWYLETGQILK
ncbi:MAG: N-glycosylase/DNA lyase [Promethearchaeota archaeon]|nr:MAG: N-glycosylase/DNA lyase [Candidatus Lokiarchaeota archaeon]